ncbi:tissue factor-like [Brienomyrus brachyistius]|uniref:tissue factor-like n=1 Tax=Brienomyrus brachyistius TaxID=42636 RepID=UPI0020B45437|nr:tissue factor-like [Brienomyrus brachyistius]
MYSKNCLSDIWIMTDIRISFKLLCVLFLLFGKNAGMNTYPKAEGVTWTSSDFKTILKWGPEPVNYTYTVEVYRQGKDGEKNEHCIRTEKTDCDLTSMLVDLNATYIADILSEPLPGTPSDAVEPPYTKSPPFCPYYDTEIGAPHFRINVTQDKSKITLDIEDPVTAIYSGRRLLNIRDIFKNDLQYKVFYRKAQSTGKREKTTSSSKVVLDVDRGVSYCFNVQAYVPSRLGTKQDGKLSSMRCSPDRDKSIFEEYSIGVIAGGIVLVIVLIGTITLTVVYCRRRKRGKDAGKEAVPLKKV